MKKRRSRGSTLLYSTLLYSTLLLVLTGCPSATGGGDDGGNGSGGSSSSLNSYVSTKYANGNTTARVASQSSWNAINCHDPKLFQDDDGTYYVYATDASCGNAEYTGLNIRYSTDLINWKVLNYSALRGNWDEDFLAWEGFSASSSDVKHSNSDYTAVTWAPTVIKQNGLYYMYHGVSADMYIDSTKYPVSAIVLAIAKSAKGPFYPASYISSYTGSNSTIKSIKSTLAGLGENGVTYKQNFLSRYCPYEFTNKGAKAYSSYKDKSNGAALNGKSIAIPNYHNCNNCRIGCIDPEFVYDVAKGKLMEYTIGGNTCYAIIYGSWSGGIALAYVDSVSLKPVALGDFSVEISDDTVVENGTYTYTLGQEMDISLDMAACTTSAKNCLTGHSNSTSTDRFLLLGVPLIGGAQSSSTPSNGASTAYEGAQLFYNSNTEYYYIITSCGGLMWEYRCALGRSSTINGEYLDAGGKDMWLGTSNYSQYHAIGSKIIGSIAFNGDYPFRSQGGLSVLRGNDGKIYFACHSRTNYLPEYIFYLQIHQMFFNEEDWPVLNMNDYYDESLKKLTASDISGTYNTVLSVRGTSTAAANTLGLYECTSDDTVNKLDAVPTTSLTMTLGADGTVGGENYYGNWTLGADGYTISITLNSVENDTTLGTFKGYVMNTVDWARKSGTKQTITFTTLCSDTSANQKGEYFWGNRIPSSSKLATATNTSGSITIEQITTPVTFSASSSTGYLVKLGVDSATMQVSSVTVNGTEQMPANKIYENSSMSWTGVNVSGLSSNSSDTWTVAYTFTMTAVGSSNWNDFNFEIRDDVITNGESGYWSLRYDNYAVGWLAGYHEYGSWTAEHLLEDSNHTAYGGHWYGMTSNLKYDHSETKDKTCILTIQKTTDAFKLSLTSDGTEVWSCTNEAVSY